MNFDGDEIDVGLRFPGDQVDAEFLIDIVDDFIVRERHLRSEQVGFIFHGIEAHVKELEFLKDSRLYPMEQVMANLMQQDKTEGSIRKVFLPKSVANMLAEWKQKQDETRICLAMNITIIIWS